MTDEKKPTETVIHIAFADGRSDPANNPDHVPTDNEKWYDAEVAPALADLMKKITDRGMACVFTVEIDKATDLVGSTRGSPKDYRAGPVMRLVQMADRCRGNIDQFLMWVMRDMKSTGACGENNPSIYMRMLERIGG